MAQDLQTKQDANKTRHPQQTRTVMMSKDICADYQTEVLYNDDYFENLSPKKLNYLATSKRYHTCDLTQPFNYLELGCGFGHSALIHAAIYPQAQFYACDFNEVQMQRARYLIDRLNLQNIKLYPMPFSELLEEELPQMDFVVSHGVYSWVNSTVRQQMHEIIQNKLKSGGLAYLSYNCLPGMGKIAPLRYMLNEMAKKKQGTSFECAKEALKELNQIKKDLQYYQDNPTIESIITNFNNSDKYMFGEIFNPIWKLFYSNEVAQEMEDIGLNFIGHANLPVNHQHQKLKPSLKPHYYALETSKEKELFLDYAFNTQFRSDVFIKDGKTMNERELISKLLKMNVGMTRSFSNLEKSPLIQGEPEFKTLFAKVMQNQVKDNAVSCAQLCEEITQGNPEQLKSSLISIMLMINMQVLTHFEHIPESSDDYKLSAINQNILNFALENNQSRALILKNQGMGYMMNLLDLFILKQWVEGERQLQVIAQKTIACAKKNPDLLLNKIDINQLTENQQNMMILDWINRFVYESLPNLKYLGLFSH